MFIISALKTANLTPRNMTHLYATGSSSDIAVAKVVTCRPPPRRTGFDSRLVRVPFMVDRVTMRRILFQYLCFPPAVHTHLLLYYQRLAKFYSVEGLPVCHCKPVSDSSFIMSADVPIMYHYRELVSNSFRPYNVACHP